MTTTSHTPKPFSMMADALESAADTFEQAAANAPESARRAARVTKRALGMGIFKAFYGISYGIVYSGVFITELFPEQSTVRRALTEGAEAAIDARHKANSKSKPKLSFDVTHAHDEHDEHGGHEESEVDSEAPARTARKVAKKRAEKFDAAVKGTKSKKSV
jgi:hypothetical protein